MDNVTKKARHHILTLERVRFFFKAVVLFAGSTQIFSGLLDAAHEMQLQPSSVKEIAFWSAVSFLIGFTLAQFWASPKPQGLPASLKWTLRIAIGIFIVTFFLVSLLALIGQNELIRSVLGVLSPYITFWVAGSLFGSATITE